MYKKNTPKHQAESQRGWSFLVLSLCKHLSENHVFTDKAAAAGVLEADYSFIPRSLWSSLGRSYGPLHRTCHFQTHSEKTQCEHDGTQWCFKHRLTDESSAPFPRYGLFCRAFIPILFSWIERHVVQGHRGTLLFLNYMRSNYLHFRLNWHLEGKLHHVEALGGTNK